MIIDLKERSVCFTGHRNLGTDLDADKLKKAVLKLIASGSDTFICGGALGFDTVAARLIMELKEQYPHIKLHLYLPCKDQDAMWSRSDRLEYKRILKAADLVDMPPLPYYDGCMKKRNYKMVDNASVCICYLSGDIKSGTAQTVRYARRMGLSIINVAESMI